MSTDSNMSQEQYWMIHLPEKEGYYTTGMYTSKDKAVAEAKRRARIRVGVIYTVLVVDSAFCCQPPDSPQFVEIQTVLLSHESENT